MRGFPVVKNLPANEGDARDSGSVPESGRYSRGGNGNPLSILAWEISWTEEPGWLQSMGSQKSQTKLSMHTHTHTHTHRSKLG